MQLGEHETSCFPKTTTSQTKRRAEWLVRTIVKKRTPAKLPEKALAGSRARHINLRKRRPTWAKEPCGPVRDLLQRNAELMQQMWEAGRNMASQLTDPSLNPVFRALGASDEEAQRAAQQSVRNMEAVLGSSSLVTQELQNISREWLEFAQSRLQQNLGYLNALGRCRTPQDAAAVQTELMRDNFEHLLQSARRTAEISARMADQATRKITENLNRERQAA